MKTANAFTLAEVLIALALLGVIATFTIPKVLNVAANETSNTHAKDAISTLSQACLNLQKDGNLSANSGPKDLMPYINYVAKDEPGATFDAFEGAGGFTCNYAPGYHCLRLASGAFITYSDATRFGGTAANYVINMYFDPDGKNGGSTTGPSKSLVIFLTPQCKLYTYGTIPTGYKTGPGPFVYTNHPEFDPTWLQW